MSESGVEAREPDGVEEAVESSAGEARSSGPEATRESMRSPAPFRLGEDELDERDERFSQPRKAQGPPLEDTTTPERMGAPQDDTSEDAVTETTPPEPSAEE